MPRKISLSWSDDFPDPRVYVREKLQKTTVSFASDQDRLKAVEVMGLLVDELKLRVGVVARLTGTERLTEQLKIDRNVTRERIVLLAKAFELELEDFLKLTKESIRTTKADLEEAFERSLEFYVRGQRET